MFVEIVKTDNSLPLDLAAMLDRKIASATQNQSALAKHLALIRLMRAPKA
jgi:hypothetical protein